jgi:hypothetical protein
MTKIDQRAFVMPPMVIGVSGGAGPSPAPTPWLRQGDHISYDRGVTVGDPVGGNMGDGMINAKGLYIDGQPVGGGGGGVGPDDVIDCGTF